MNEVSHYSGKKHCTELETSSDDSDVEVQWHDAVDSLQVRQFSGNGVTVPPNNFGTFGDIHIEESNHIRIGNQNSYNGPITIQQIFNSQQGTSGVFPGVPVSAENVCTLKNEVKCSDPEALKKNSQRKCKFFL